MSLEQAIKDLTVAVEQQNANFAAYIETIPAGAVEGEKAPSKKKSAPKKSKAKKEEPKEEAEDENIHDKKFYKETVQPTTRKAAKALGRDKVMSILDEFGTGLETAKDLEEGQWEEYVARLEAELSDDEEEEDDLS